MRSYLIVTCAIFALLVVAHLLRVMAEGSRVAADPWFVAATAIAAGLSLWAWRLLRRLRKERKP